MSHHTREAFDRRMAARRADPTPVAPHGVFYHAALMPGWEPIAAEQMAVCAAAGLTDVHAFALAPRAGDADRLVAIARHYGVALRLLGTDRRLDRYEVPTLDAAWEWATAHPGGVVTYFHTKGASNPLDAHKRQWRRVMGRVVLAEWRTNLGLLEVHDLVGAAWQHLPDFPHFAGNFWAARCDWLAHLDRPEAYRRARLVGSWAGHPWDRMCAELWLGSRPWHAMFDRLPQASGRIHTDAVHDYPGEVTGVDYAGPFFTAPYTPDAPGAAAAPPRLSVIIPTSRPDLLPRAVESVVAELEPGDELIVKCDASGDYGAAPRNAAMAQAVGTHIMFLDDDDRYVPGWAAAVRRRIRAHPGAVLVFRMRTPDGGLVWRTPALVLGNVGTPTIVVPNDKGRLAAWGTRYGHDHDFLAETADRYPPGAVVWCPEVIAEVRPAGGLLPAPRRPLGGTTVILIAAGEATRWGGHLGVRKHFAPVDGEPVLARAVRLFEARGATVFVVSKAGEGYEAAGGILYVPAFEPGNAEADKFLNSRSLWNPTGRTVVAYGDVYFTEAAVDRIAGHAAREWTLFGRSAGSALTGCPWGECFAQSFWPEHVAEHVAALHRVVALRTAGGLDRCGGWEHYRAMLGVPDAELSRHVVGDRFVEVDDWTDDFDHPEDYDRFLLRRAGRGRGPGGPPAPPS